MPRAEAGDTVRVHYTGTLEDGTIFDTSMGKEPFQFAIGWGEVIPGFEKAVIGMSPGEMKTVTIPTSEAYGPYREDMVGLVNRDDFPPDIELKEGMILQVQLPLGQRGVITVAKVFERSVIIDGNHPLAGKDLTFDIILVDIV